MSVFSRRHRRALADGKLVVELDERTRTRIWRFLQRNNASQHIQYDPNDQWTTETDTLSEVFDALKDVWGVKPLPGTSAKDGNLAEFVSNGPGEGVLDTLELFMPWMSEPERRAVRATLNELLAEQDTPWRMLEAEMVLLDSVFVHEQVVATAREMAGHHGYEGAADEMRRAQHDLHDDDPRGTIHNAGSSFESTAKAVLGVNHGTAKQLITKLKEEGYFDGLPDEYIDGFASNVLESVPWMRNRLGGHGQGRAAFEPPKTYAKLALHLAAALNQFLIELKLERDGQQPPEEMSTGDFATVYGSDDDIPF